MQQGNFAIGRVAKELPSMQQKMEEWKHTAKDKVSSRDLPPDALAAVWERYHHSCTSLTPCASDRAEVVAAADLDAWTNKGWPDACPPAQIQRLVRRGARGKQAWADHLPVPLGLQARAGLQGHGQRVQEVPAARIQHGAVTTQNFIPTMMMIFECEDTFLPQ